TSGLPVDWLSPVLFMNQQQLEVQLRLMGPYLKRYAALWCQPDSEGGVRELSSEAWDGQYGFLPLIVTTPSRRYFDIVEKIVERLKTTTTALSQVISGPPVPQSPAPTRP